jgi:hypothetical protein
MNYLSKLKLLEENSPEKPQKSLFYEKNPKSIENLNEEIPLTSN